MYACHVHMYRKYHINASMPFISVKLLAVVPRETRSAVSGKIRQFDNAECRARTLQRTVPDIEFIAVPVWCGTPSHSHIRMNITN